VAIARALASRPDVIVADEPTSSLDVSVRASILNLLNDLQTADGLAFLFISHDLSAIRQIAHRVLVLYLGMVMEEGATERIFRPPHHPYTEALLSAVPVPDPDVRTVPIRLMGAVPSADRLPSGCPFHTRCPRKLGPICEEQTPPWRDAGADHRIFCHIPLDELRAVQVSGSTATTNDSDLPRS
jgi:peptide/nickel transport system ATP-binding protein